MSTQEVVEYVLSEEAVAENKVAVITYVRSPSRTALVIKRSRKDPLLKMPGGGVEKEDIVPGDAKSSIINTSIRETKEETGIVLLPEEIDWVYWDSRDNQHRYSPHFCVAQVSEEKLDTCVPYGGEDGFPIETYLFKHEDVKKQSMLPNHLSFILEMEEIFRNAA